MYQQPVQRLPRVQPVGPAVACGEQYGGGWRGRPGRAGRGQPPDMAAEVEVTRLPASRLQRRTSSRTIGFTAWTRAASATSAASFG